MHDSPSIDRQLLKASIERLQKLGGLRPPAEEARLMALKNLLQDQLQERQIQFAFSELLAAYNLMPDRNLDKLKERVWLFFGPPSNGLELQILGIVLLGSADALLEENKAEDLLGDQLLRSYGLGSTEPNEDEMPEARGRFGYEPGNPIPVNGIDQLNNYLDKLSLHTGESITYRRSGSLQQAGFPYPLDRYEICNLAGEVCATLYFYAYHGSTSQQAPEGFRFLGD